MRRIIYAGGEFLTGDRIAAALLEYSRALAEADEADNVDIPVRAEGGERATATLLVGPSSQIVVVDTPSAHDELLDDVVVARLRSRTRALRPTATAVGEPLLEDSVWNDDI